LRTGNTIRAAPIATIWQRRRSDGNEEEARYEAQRGKEERTPRCGEEALGRQEEQREAWRQEGGEAARRQEER
jgi:hypothetical protein